MKKITAQKIVFKLIFFFFISHYTAYSQASKYLIYNNLKDTIIEKSGIKYYKIDENYFDLSKYDDIMIISKLEFDKIKFISVDSLWIEGRSLFSITSDKKNKFLETYNEIFTNIYVIEKINKNKYKSTRVWWLDYENGLF